jgi:hypothetical protein
MVGGDAAFKLGDEVRRQGDARVVLLDLSELVSLGGDVMGVRIFFLAQCLDISQSC